MPRRYPPIFAASSRPPRAQMLDGDAEGLLAQIESELRIARFAFEEIQHAAPIALDELRLGAPIAARNSLRKVGGGLRLFLRVIGGASTICRPLVRAGSFTSQWRAGGEILAHLPALKLTGDPMTLSSVRSP